MMAAQISNKSHQTIHFEVLNFMADEFSQLWKTSCYRDEMANFSCKSQITNILVFWAMYNLLSSCLFFFLMQTFKNVKPIMSHTKTDTGQIWPISHRHWSQGLCMLLRHSTTKPHPSPVCQTLGRVLMWSYKLKRARLVISSINYFNSLKCHKMNISINLKSKTIL